MKKTSAHIIFVVIFLLLSCNNGKNKNEGKIVIIPEQLIFYSPFTNSDSLSAYGTKSPYKIYTLIDASCSSCFGKFKLWNDFQKMIEGVKNVEIIAICHSKDNFEIIKYLFENNEIEKTKFPVFLDSSDEFKKLNAELIQNPLKFAALTDSNNRVLLLGDPINNKKDKNRFLRKIRTLAYVSK